MSLPPERPNRLVPCCAVLLALALGSVCRAQPPPPPPPLPPPPPPGGTTITILGNGQPSPLTVAPGATVTFTVTVTGCPPQPAGIGWFDVWNLGFSLTASPPDPPTQWSQQALPSYFTYKLNDYNNPTYPPPTSPYLEGFDLSGNDPCNSPPSPVTYTAPTTPGTYTVWYGFSAYDQVEEICNIVFFPVICGGPPYYYPLYYPLYYYYYYGPHDKTNLETDQASFTLASKSRSVPRSILTPARK
jgi:hypothetical protein